MRLAIVTALALGLALLVNGGVTEAGGKASTRAVDIKGLNLGEANGKVNAPTVIANAEDLAKAVPNKEAREAIAKLVDFGKEKLLFFAWSGSGGDRLGFSDAVVDGKPVVQIHYQPGKTFDLRPHHYLFATAKDATWELAKKK